MKDRKDWENRLKWVLGAKIGITLVFWSLPFLVFPESLFKSLFEGIGMPPLTPIVFFRLLGAAYLALTVGYILGFKDLSKGKDIPNVVIVGIVSNGLAALVVFYYCFTETWQGWKGWSGVAPMLMWASGLTAFLITVGLAICGWRLYVGKAGNTNV